MKACSGVPEGMRRVRMHPLRILSAFFSNVKCPFCPLFRFKIITREKYFTILQIFFMLFEITISKFIAFYYE